jgi:hypothetical protein
MRPTKMRPYWPAIGRNCLLAFLLSGWTPALASADAPAWERINLDLITHDSILIDRPPAAIWPLILDNSAWKQGVKALHVSGSRGQVGEVFAATLRDSSSKPLFYMQNIEVVDSRRRTIKLYDAGGGPLIGYASWELLDLGGKTRVSYHVYAEIPLPVEEARDKSPESVAKKQSRYTAKNRSRFQAELKALKRLIETPLTRRE